MSNIYLGTIDAGGRGDELLVRAINATEGSNFSLTDFAFGEPEPVTGVPNPTHNTKIILAPYAATGYYGARTIYYNRIHANRLPAIIVPWAGERYLSDLLVKIGERYGIYIEAGDIEDGQVPTPPNGETNVKVTLTFKPSSIIFYSSVEIQVGQNDPTGDTSIIEDFAANIVLVNDESYLIPVISPTGEEDRNDDAFTYQNFSTLVVDRYPNRQHDVMPGLEFFGKNTKGMARRRLGQLANIDGVSDKTAAGIMLEANVPFVGMWMDGDGISYGITPAGEVFSMTSKGTEWKFAGNPMGYPLVTPFDIRNAYRKVNVKAVTQSVDGKVHVVALTTAGAPAVFQVPVKANTPASQIAITTVRSLAMAAVHWPYIVVIDFQVTADRVGLIIDFNRTKFRNKMGSNDIEYPSDSPTGTTLPSVELFVINGDNSYYSLVEKEVVGGGIDITNITIEDGSAFGNRIHRRHALRNFCFISSSVASPVLDIAGVVIGSKNWNIYPVVYRQQAGGGYQIQVIPNANIGLSEFGDFDFSVAAYRIQIPNGMVRQGTADVNNAYLEVIECLAPVASDNYSSLFDKYQAKRQNGWLSYGVCSWSTVATSATVNNGWNFSSYELPGDEEPYYVTLHGTAGRQFMVVQSGTAVTRTRMVQTVGATKFKAEIGFSVGLSASKGSKSFVGQASAILQPWAPVLDVDTKFTVAPVIVATPPASVRYSFIARNASDQRSWLVQTHGAQAPVIKTIPITNQYLGKAPLATMACDSSLLVLTENGNGVYESSDNGYTWNEFISMSAEVRTKGTSWYNTEKISSFSKVRYDEKNLREGVYMASNVSNAIKGSMVAIELDLVANVQVVKADSVNVSDTLSMSGNFLMKSYGHDDNRDLFLQRNSANLLSQWSPMKMLAWDSDADGNFSTAGYFTDPEVVPTIPFNDNHQMDNYTYGIPGELVDFSRDVNYLGYRQWVLMKETNGGNEHWKLHFTNAVAPEKTIDLFGGVGAYSSFKPKVSFHLWDFEVPGGNYIPYVFVDNNRVLILERVQQDGTFGTTLASMTIPGDNGQELVPVRMYTANRRDYLFFQKGNGIFKIDYLFRSLAEPSEVTLTRVSSLASTDMNALEIISGCIVGIPAANAPGEVLLPSNLPEGTPMGFACDGTTKVLKFADGSGYSTKVREDYSTDCGYVPPDNEVQQRVTITGGDTNFAVGE